MSKVTNILFALLYMGILFIIYVFLGIDSDGDANNRILYMFGTVALMGVVAMWYRIIFDQNKSFIVRSLVWLPFIMLVLLFIISFFQND